MVFHIFVRDSLTQSWYHQSHHQHRCHPVPMLVVTVEVEIGGNWVNSPAFSSSLYHLNASTNCSTQHQLVPERKSNIPDKCLKLYWWIRKWTCFALSTHISINLCLHCPSFTDPDFRRTMREMFSDCILINGSSFASVIRTNQKTLFRNLVIFL